MPYVLLKNGKCGILVHKYYHSPKYGFTKKPKEDSTERYWVVVHEPGDFPKIKDMNPDDVELLHYRA